jgi:L-malate glycosyltransferase
MHLKKNICFFIGSFQVGGAETHVLSILRNLDKQKYNPILVVFSDKGELRDQFLKLELTVKVFEVNIFTYLYRLISFIFFLKQQKIKILHSHLVGTFLFSSIGGKFASVPKRIITWHGIYDSSRLHKRYTLKDLKFIFVLKIANKLSTKIISVSGKVKNLNCDFYKVPVSKVFVIYNCIDPPKFQPQFNDSLELNNHSKITIGSLGNLRVEKGYFFLLNSIKRLKKKYPNIQLQIAGDGDLKEELSKEIEKLNLINDVKLLGHIDNKNIFFNSIDIYVSSSLFEGFSVALIEALSYGKAIIATDVGGNAEAVIDNNCGIIIQPGSVDQIVTAIDILINNSSKKITFEKNAYKRFGDFFLTRQMMNKLEKVYT